MNSDQKAVIQASFLKIVANSINMAELFYNTLFRHRPEFKALFKSDQMMQGEKFIAMIGFVVNNLYNEEVCERSLTNLAKRHVSYNVKKEDYEVVGKVLVETLAIGLEQDFTSEVEAAWRQLYTEISHSMVKAAYK